MSYPWEHQQRASTRLSTKGQLIIPKPIRERYGWRAGTELVVEDLGNGVFLRPVDVPETTLDDVVGCAGYDGPRRDLDELDELDQAITGGTRGRR